MIGGIFWQNYEDFVEDEIRTETFNLNKEREECYFDVDGNFIEYMYIHTTLWHIYFQAFLHLRQCFKLRSKERVHLLFISIYTFVIYIHLSLIVDYYPTHDGYNPPEIHIFTKCISF